MLGVFCGYIMQSHLNKKSKLRNYIILGVSLILLALIWENWLPIIKKIWTSSFVLFSGGICVLLLALFYLIIDIWEIRKGTKWMVVLGANAIFGYVATWRPFSKAFMSIARALFDGLMPYIANWYDILSYLGGFLVIYILMWYMYKNKTFVRI